MLKAIKNLFKTKLTDDDVIVMEVLTKLTPIEVTNHATDNIYTSTIVFNDNVRVDSKRLRMMSIHKPHIELYVDEVFISMSDSWDVFHAFHDSARRFSHASTLHVRAKLHGLLGED